MPSASKKILLICPHPENVAPGQRLKYEQYFGFLREAGYEITVSSFMTLRFWNIVYKKGRTPEKIFWVGFGYLKRVFDLMRIRRYDGLYIFLNVTPLGGAFFEYLYRLFAKKIIYDIDDLVFLGKTSAVNKGISALKSPKKYHYLMKHADHVITCTPYLDKYVRQFNSQTTDISSTILTDKYVPIESYDKTGTLTLGWSGSHSTVAYLRLLSPVLFRLRQKFRFRLLVIGTPRFELPEVPDLEIEAIQWQEAHEVRDLSRIDIGLYPLPDEQWVYGKSGLKALQYMALGIPTLATAIGANFRVIEDGVSGFLVRTDDEWVEKLSALMTDPMLRDTIGRKGRERVERLYSVRANIPNYLGVFSKVYQSSPEVGIR
jgi:glycosyltransferase involved in cell wall biosynthesis